MSSKNLIRTVLGVQAYDTANLKVSISTEFERQLNTSLASSLDIVRVGITQEYAPSIVDGAKLKLQETGISNIFGSGEIS